MSCLALYESTEQDKIVSLEQHYTEFLKIGGSLIQLNWSNFNSKIVATSLTK